MNCLNCDMLSERIITLEKEKLQLKARYDIERAAHERTLANAAERLDDMQGRITRIQRLVDELYTTWKKALE